MKIQPIESFETPNFVFCLVRSSRTGQYVISRINHIGKLAILFNTSNKFEALDEFKAYKRTYANNYGNV